MAAPFVAGVAVLMLDAAPDTTAAGLKDMLVKTADDRTALGADVDSGAGRIRAYEAVKVAGAFDGTGPEDPDRYLTGSQQLSASGASDSWNLEVSSTAYPLALTLIIPGASPERDFAVSLYDPVGVLVVKSQNADRQEEIGVTPLVTGTYRAEVNSVAGSGDYHLDLSYRGPAPVKQAIAPPAVGAGTYEDAHSAIGYTGTWTTLSNSGDSGGSVKYTYAASATAELRFNGTAIQWLARRQSNAGITDVYLDGTKVASVDLYNGTLQQKQVVFEKTGLASGEHTIRIVRTGTKNASSKNTYQFLDAFVVSG